MEMTVFDTALLILEVQHQTKYVSIEFPELAIISQYIFSNWNKLIPHLLVAKDYNPDGDDDIMFEL